MVERPVEPVGGLVEGRQGRHVGRPGLEVGRGAHARRAAQHEQRRRPDQSLARVQPGRDRLMRIDNRDVPRGPSGGAGLEERPPDALAVVSPIDEQRREVPPRSAHEGRGIGDHHRASRLGHKGTPRVGGQDVALWRGEHLQRRIAPLVPASRVQLPLGAIEDGPPRPEIVGRRGSVAHRIGVTHCLPPWRGGYRARSGPVR